MKIIWTTSLKSSMEKAKVAVSAKLPEQVPSAPSHGQKKGTTGYDNDTCKKKER